MGHKPTEFAYFGVQLAKAELHSDANGQRTLVGYATAFDYPVPGDLGETIYIRPGALTKTIKENGPNVQVLYHHGQDPDIGEKPLGVPAVMRPDKTGLWTETPLAKTRYNEETIIPLLESGALRSMSIQFVPTQQSWNADRTERSIEQLALVEFGPTPFPRNLGATAALHSRSLGMVDVPATDGIVPDQQAEASERDRGSILDPDRLTWDAKATTLLHAWEREQAEREAWMTREAERWQPR